MQQISFINAWLEVKVPKALAFGCNLFVKLSPAVVLVPCNQTLSLAQDHQTQQFVAFVIAKSSPRGPAVVYPLLAHTALHSPGCSALLCSPGKCITSFQQGKSPYQPFLAPPSQEPTCFQGKLLCFLFTSSLFALI